jgi:putative ABC transport system permease protein
MTPLRLAYLNLTRRPVPTIIAILAIAISVACAGVLLRLNILADSRFTTLGNGGDAIIGAKSGGIDILLGALNSEGKYPGFLPLKLYETLKADTTVHFEDGAQSKASAIRAIIPFLYFAKYENYRVVATDESFITRPLPSDSLHFAKGSWAVNPNEIVLGSAVARAKNLYVGDSVSAKAWLGEKIFISQDISFKVVGILDPTKSSWDRTLFSNIPTAQSILASVNLAPSSVWGPQVLNYFMIYLQPPGFDALAGLINNRTVGQAVLVQEESHKLSELVGTGQDLAFFITVLVLVLGGLSVASMLITRFEAMSLQLAVLRALGYKKFEIGRWLLWEGFLMGAVACCLGLILDAIIFPLVRSLLGDSLPSAEIVSSPLWYSAPVWITALCATVLSVFIPLYRVYHQDVHRSLRG